MEDEINIPNVCRLDIVAWVRKYKEKYSAGILEQSMGD